MKIEELDKFLAENQDDLEWRTAEKGEKIGDVVIENDSTMLIWSNEWETLTALDLNELEKITPAFLKSAIAHGKNVQQISRVTGFFSVIRNWNPGKRGELKDRYRVTDGWGEK